MGSTDRFPVQPPETRQNASLTSPAKSWVEIHLFLAPGVNASLDFRGNVQVALECNPRFSSFLLHPVQTLCGFRGHRFCKRPAARVIFAIRTEGDLAVRRRLRRLRLPETDASGRLCLPGGGNASGRSCMLSRSNVRGPRIMNTDSEAARRPYTIDLAQLSELLPQAEDSDFWRRLSPEMAISDDPSGILKGAPATAPAEMALLASSNPRPGWPSDRPVPRAAPAGTPPGPRPRPGRRPPR